MPDRRTIVAAAALALLGAAVAGYWAHPFAHGPLRGEVHIGKTQDVLCMPDVGSDRFRMGIALWNSSKSQIQIQRLELEKPVGVRLGRAYVVGVANQTLLGSSSQGFAPTLARQSRRATWVGRLPATDSVIPLSTKDEKHELLIELIRTSHEKSISVNAVKIEYSTGWRRTYWARSTVRHVIKTDCRRL